MNNSDKSILIGIFVFSCASLMVEISLIRVFDVLFYPNIAYMIITCCLFAYGLAGVYSVMRPLREDQSPRIEAVKLSILFALSIAAILPVMNLLPFNFNNIAADPVRQILYFMAMYVAIALPFFLAGRIFSIIFTAYAKRIQVVYFWDLAGAALGSIAVIPLVPWIGPGGILLFAAAISLAASTILLRRKAWSIAAVAVSAGLIAAPVLYSPGYIDFIEHQGKRGVKSAREEGKIETTVWDPISKIDIIDYGTIRYIAYDGGSQSSIFYPFDGDFQSLRQNLPEELANHFWQRGVLASHYLKQGTNPKVLVIGSAGGQEIKAALMYGASHVDGIEMVGAVVELGAGKYSSYIGGLFQNPSVSVKVEEGRSFLRASQEQYDIIQIFSNHTSSSIAAGTGAAATNYLQTSDAYIEYFSHLSENGILHINHYYYPRMVTTAAKAWAQLGRSDFYRHVVVFEYDQDETLPTLLIKMQPWTEQELDAVKHFFAEVYPGENARYTLVVDPLHPETSSLPLEYFSGELSPETLQRVDIRIEPATDDRPYFNFLTKSFNPFPNGIASFIKDPMGSIPLGLATLLIPGIVAVFYAAVLIVLPLSFSAAGKQKWPNKGASLLYFSLLGLGFIIVEFVFIQLFMRLIGSPLYTYSSVIFILLFGAGVGSFVSHRLKITPRRGWYLPFIGILVSILLLMLLYPPVSRVFLAMPVLIRIAVALIFMFPVGFFMGMPFPLGILTLENRPRGSVAWAWGMNGLFTVIGGLLGVAFSIQWGFTTTLLIACCCYVLALLTLARIRTGLQTDYPES